MAEYNCYPLTSAGKVKIDAVKKALPGFGGADVFLVDASGKTIHRLTGDDYKTKTDSTLQNFINAPASILCGKPDSGQGEQPFGEEAGQGAITRLDTMFADWEKNWPEFWQELNKKNYLGVSIENGHFLSSKAGNRDLTSCDDVYGLANYLIDYLQKKGIKIGVNNDGLVVTKDEQEKLLTALAQFAEDKQLMSVDRAVVVVRTKSGKDTITQCKGLFFSIAPWEHFLPEEMVYQYLACVLMALLEKHLLKQQEQKPLAGHTATSYMVPVYQAFLQKQGMSEEEITQAMKTFSKDPHLAFTGESRSKYIEGALCGQPIHVPRVTQQCGYPD